MAIDIDRPLRGKRTETLQVMLNAREIQQVDAWRIRRGLGSRSAALRELIGLGFAAFERDRDGVEVPRPETPLFSCD